MAKKKRGRIQRALDASPRKALDFVQDRLYSLVSDRAQAALIEKHPAIAEVIHNGGALVAEHTEVHDVQEKTYDEIGRSEYLGNESFGGGEEQTRAQVFGTIYQKHLWTNTCVEYIASNVPQGDLRFFTTTRLADGTKERTPAFNHPLAKLFAWWNPLQSPSEAWEFLTSWLLLSGTCYVAFTSRGPETPPGIPFEIYPLFPQGVRIVRSAEGILGYNYRVNGQDSFFLPEEVWRVATFHPSDRFSGLGRLEAGLQEVRTDLKARNWNESLISKGVHVSGTLETQDDLGEDKAEQTRKSFMQKYAGQSNAAKIAILYGGLQFKPMTLSHQDIGWLEQIQLTKQDIADAFNIPMELFGKAANFATLQGKRRIFWNDVVVKWAAKLTDSLNTSILQREAPGLECEFDYSHVDALQPDKDAEAKRGQIAISSGQVTINEWRQSALQLEPVQGGDVLLVGRGVVPLDETLANAAAAVASATDPGGSDEEEDAAPATRAMREGRLPTQLRLALPTPVNKAASEWERLFEENLLRGSKEYELMVRKMFREFAESTVEILESTLDAQTKVEAAQKAIVVDGKKAMVSRSNTILKKWGQKYGAGWLQQTELASAINLRNFRGEEILAKSANRVVGLVNDRWVEMRASIVEGVTQGESEAELAARIQEYWHGERQSSAATIARTEVGAALNGTGREMAELSIAAGEPLLLEWLTSKDERVRDTHIAANTQRVNPAMKEAFVVGGDRLEYPGDPSGSAEQVINCRCTTIPIVVNKARR